MAAQETCEVSGPETASEYTEYDQRSESKHIIVSGILPRSRASTIFYDRVFSTNSRLLSFCANEGADYVNLWDNFYNKHFLFQSDGLHLNGVGAA